MASKGIKIGKKEFTRQDMVGFGNYMLSNYRRDNKIVRDSWSMKSVWDADIANWLHFRSIGYNGWQEFDRFVKGVKVGK